MREDLGPIIARRRYFNADEEAEIPVVEAEIHAPAPSPHSEGEFLCHIRLRSSKGEQVETVFGVDELQALQLALGHLEAVLRRLMASSGLRLRWEAGEPGDLGIRIPNFSD